MVHLFQSKQMMQFSFLLLCIIGWHSINYCLAHCSGKLDYGCGEGASPECVPSAWRCDNVKDCSNGKDEVNCNYIFCPTNTFKCKSRECLAPSTKCDGKEDCADGSDEAFCDVQSSSTNQNYQNQQQDNIEEQGGEISLDSSAEHSSQVTTPSTAWRNQRGEQDCVSRHNKPVLNFTGTYMDEGNKIEGHRMYVAVDEGQKKVFTLEEAFDRDAWRLVQYLAGKLR